MKMARTLLSAAGAALALLVAVGRCENSLPVTHPEPITIQILDGKGGTPLAHVHVELVAGYDDRDLQLGLWSAEAITDSHGQMSLPNALKSFSFVAVWVDKHKLCGAHGRMPGVSLDRIRKEGSSTANECGVTVVEDTPGVLRVFAVLHAPFRYLSHGLSRLFI